MVKGLWGKTRAALVSRGAFVLIPLLLALGVISIFILPNAFVSESDIPDDVKRVELRQKERAAILQSLTGLLILAGAYVAWRQVQVNREGQVTERFTRVIDQLGDDKPTVRIGGVYALESLAKEPSVDRAAVIAILSAYIREHSPWPPPHADKTDPSLEAPPSPVDFYRLLPLSTRAADAHAALRVLLRIMPKEFSKLDLSSTDLRKVSLRKANLHGAILWRSNLQLVDLRDADLRDANLVGARLEYAVLNDANLDKASLGDGDISAQLTNAAANSATWPDGFDAEAAGIVTMDKWRAMMADLSVKEGSADKASL